MARENDKERIVRCSFCGKTQEQVEKLIAGPGVYICDECIELCMGIIDENADRNYKPSGKKVKLEEKGLVKIEATIKNNRAVKILTITEKGKKLAKNSTDLFEPLKKQIEKEFSKEKLDEMTRTLHDFTQLISKTLKTKI